MNQAIHAVGLLQWLAGPLVEAHTHTARYAHPDIEVESVAEASLPFVSGALGTLLATTAEEECVTPSLTRGNGGDGCGSPPGVYRLGTQRNSCRTVLWDTTVRAGVPLPVQAS